jgi:hypothetical protein
MENIDAASLILGWLIGVATPFGVAWLLLGLNRMVADVKADMLNDPKEPGAPD